MPITKLTARKSFEILAEQAGPTLSDILSQAEIEELLTSLSSDATGSDRPEPHQVAKKATGAGPNFGSYSPKGKSFKGGSYELYDFRRPDKFSKEQLRTLQMLHDTFARLAGSSLSAYLRSQVNIDLISLEQVPYEEYLRSINQSVFTVMSLPPLTGQAVLEIEFGLVFTMIDRLLGGPGRNVSRTSLTDIERPLVKQTVERMFAALKTAWEGIVIVSPGVEGMETSAQFVQIAPPSDIVVTILFEVRIGGARGAMSLCVPYLVLKPVTQKLSAQKWFVSTNRRHNPQYRQQLSSQIQHSKVECAVQLGNARMSIEDFLSLRPGDIVRLDQKTEAELPLLVSNTPKFEGRTALNGKKLVFHVSGAYDL